MPGTTHRYRLAHYAPPLPGYRVCCRYPHQAALCGIRRDRSWIHIGRYNERGSGVPIRSKRGSIAFGRAAMLFEPGMVVLRRKAFALAGELVGKGEPTYALLRDLTGMESMVGQTAGFWSGLVDRLRQLQRRKDREAPDRTGPRWRHIQALRAQLGMTDDHWRNFLKQHLKIDHQRFLTASKTRDCIAALKRMTKRNGLPPQLFPVSGGDRGTE